MPAPPVFDVTERVVVERHTTLHGTIRAEFTPGRHGPTSEQEAYLLAEAVRLGHAERVDPQDLQPDNANRPDTSDQPTETNQEDE